MIAEPVTTRETKTRTESWTYDEVRAIDDDVQRELHDGEIYLMPSPVPEHQDIIGQLYLQLMAWARQHGGKAYLSPIDLYVSQTEYYIPDLVFYSARQLQEGAVPRGTKRLTMAPAIVVEVLSRSTARNDRTLKTRAYAKFGIPHYWILDPIAQTLEAFELIEGRYSLAGAIGADETYAPEAFAELQIVGAELFPGDATESQD